MLSENNPVEVKQVIPPTVSTPEEVLDTRSAEEIEADILRQAEEDGKKFEEDVVNRDPAEIAAMAFHMYFPVFQNLTTGLSNKELKRLVNALVGKGHVSQPEIPKFKDKKAGEAYKMGLELLQAKFMMITRLEMNQLQEQINAAAENKDLNVRNNAEIETSFEETQEEGNIENGT